ncbi:MAG: UbiD family decarboxylase [Chloroflexi bacterium]|nr:UbiD family decarboxylase [Chloroflexota bacterium]
MGYADLREYISALDEAGELARVKDEVDWNLEIGAVMRRSYEVGAPAIHFRNIKGYGSEYSVLGAPMGRGRHGYWSRLAIALELDPHISYQELREEFIRRITSPIRPYQVSTGPCKENVISGPDVNLLQFPVPYLDDGDGGRYIGTWATTITKDLDSEWVNWGVYRQAIYSKRRAVGLILPSSHMGQMYYEKYEPKGKAMPFAIAIGTDPCVTIASSFACATRANEADIAGGLRVEPVQLVKCETNDLLVPADSEIVVEGVILPHERLPEGPFGDISGYRTLPRRPRPVYRVTCVTHRDNPILPVAASGGPTNEEQILTCLGTDAQSMQAFAKRGWQVSDCFSPPWMGAHYMAIRTKMPYMGFRDQLISAVRQTTGGRMLPVIQILDDDVEPTDIEMVFHSWITKCHPRRNIHIINETPVLPFVASLEASERDALEDHNRRYAAGSSLFLDTTWPLDWDPVIAIPPRASFVQIYPKEIQEKVLARWHTDYGFPVKEKNVEIRR